MKVGVCARLAGIVGYLFDSNLPCAAAAYCAVRNPRTLPTGEQCRSIVGANGMSFSERRRVTNAADDYSCSTQGARPYQKARALQLGQYKKITGPPLTWNLPRLVG